MSSYYTFSLMFFMNVFIFTGHHVNCFLVDCTSLCQQPSDHGSCVCDTLDMTNHNSTATLVVSNSTTSSTQTTVMTSSTTSSTPVPTTTSTTPTSSTTTISSKQSICDYLCSIQMGGAACSCSISLVPGRK
ncbi:hypothetical protein ACF0H5_011694 [Mactra antiquata]